MSNIESIRFLFILFLLTVNPTGVPSENETFRCREFTGEETCGFQQRIQHGCLQKRSDGVSSLLSCGRLCGSGCIGVVMSKNESCYLSKQCNATVSCTPGETKITIYNKNNPCQHGGIWTVENDTCQCVDGWVGDYCERLPNDCRDLKVYGYPIGGKRGYHWVNLDLGLDSYLTPVRVRCQLHERHENIMLMLSTGILSNNRTYEEYLKGFYNDESNFWVGLEIIKALNDAGFTRLYLNAGFHGPYGFNLFQRIFYHFEMGDVSTGFNFTYGDTEVIAQGSLSNNLTYGNCFSPVRGGQFCTWDQDNDEVPEENCAAQAGVGWWFKDCNMTCNPLGWSYETKPGTESEIHVKMDGIDYVSRTYATSSETRMAFFGKKYPKLGK